MAALNFPTENLQAGVTQYTSDLGTTYIWDGVKWVGHSAGGSVGTNSIANNGNTVQVDAGGNLVLPEYSLPNTVGTESQVLTWPASGTVLEWTDQTGTGNGVSLPADAAGYLINDGSGNLSWTAGTNTGTGVLNIYNNTIESESGNTFVNFGGPYDSLVIGTNEERNLVISLNENNDETLWIFTSAGNVELPNNQIIDASAANILKVGTSDAELYLDSLNNIAKITAKKTFSRNFSASGDGAETVVYTTGSIAIQFRANDGLYFKQLLSRLVNYFDGNPDLPYDYSNVTLVINPSTDNLVSTVTNVTSDNNDPPQYTITLGTAHTGPITIDDLEISYDYNNTIGLDVDNTYFGMATDDDDITISSGRDIDLLAADDVRLNAGSFLEIQLKSDELQDPEQGIELTTATTVGSKTWTFRFDGNLELPAGGDIVDSNGNSVLDNIGTSFETPLPDWIDVIASTEHFPILNTDYGFDSTGVWTVNSTIGGSSPEGTSYPFRTAFSIANNLKTVVTVDFVVNNTNFEGAGNDFGIAVFATGTNPEWSWAGIGGNRIGAQYNGDNPVLYGLSDGDAGTSTITNAGTYRARLTVEPVDPGVAEITLETLTTSGTVLNTITYTETSFFNTDYKIGFASDQDNGVDKTYFKNLTINIDNGATVYTDSLTDYSSVLVANQNQLVNGNVSVILNSDGTLTLPQLSTIADVEAGIELTINRESPHWYSIYGDLNTQSTGNATVTGSITSDTGGNVYVLGSIVDSTNGNFDGNNLLLKYNTDGELQWSRTWTDADGMNCGSYNATTRYLPPTVGTSDRETMYYASYVGGGIARPYSYVGTMDMEGELVDGFGNVRAAVEFANIRIADIEVGVGSNVYVVGARIDNLYTNTTVTPFIAKVDLDTYTANLALTVSSYYHDGTNTNPWTNFFKSATHDGTALYTIGTYYNDDWGYDWPILTKHIDGGYTRTYHLTNSNQYANIYGEEVAYSTVNDAVYVLMNSTDSDDFAVIGELASDLSGYTWIRRFGNNGIQVRLFSMEFDADGFIYIIGDLSGVDNGEFILIKMADNGDLVWQRKIGTTAGYEGSGDGEWGPPGWSSSSSIIIDGTDIVFTGLTNGAQTNAVTMKYPTDGSLTGNFGNFHAVEYDVGFVDDWGDSIYDRTADTSVTEINGNINLVNDINSASLLATTKTLDAGFSTYHWDMTNNHIYIAERKWTFGVDGSITLPSGAYLEEDEPGTLNIHSTGGTAINYAKHAQVADYQEGETTFAGVTAASGGVTVTVDKKISSSNVERNEWIFRNNSGLQFPDGTTQYGAYIETEIALDGGFAATVFNIPPIPTIADGGGSGSRFGVNDPVYDGSNGNDYVLDGGGA